MLGTGVGVDGLVDFSKVVLEFGDEVTDVLVVSGKEVVGAGNNVVVLGRLVVVVVGESVVLVDGGTSVVGTVTTTSVVVVVSGTVVVVVGASVVVVVLSIVVVVVSGKLQSFSRMYRSSVLRPGKTVPSVKVNDGIISSLSWCSACALNCTESSSVVIRT